MVHNDLESPTRGEPLDLLGVEFHDADATTRWNAVKGVGRLDPALAAPFVPRLIAAISDRSIIVRVSAAESLGRIDPAKPEVVGALTEALRDKYATVREAAVMALGNAGRAGLPAVSALRDALADESKYVRKEAADALARIASTFSGESLSILLTDLSDASPRCRALAAFLIGEMGEEGRPALEVLSGLRDDPDEEVRRAAAEAIGKLNSPRQGEAPGTVEAHPAQAAEATGGGTPASDPDPSRAEMWGTIPAFEDSSPWDDDSGFMVSFATRTDVSPDPAGPGPVKESGPTRWLIPASLSGGSLGQGLRYERLLRIVVPVPCRLVSDSSLVTPDKAQLFRGPHQILLTIGPVAQLGPLRTRLRLTTPSMERPIDIEFGVVAVPFVDQSPAPHRAILWQPPNWTKLLAQAPARAVDLGTSQVDSSFSTYRDPWNRGSDLESSERMSDSSESDRGSLVLIESHTPGSTRPPIRSLSYQAYRTKARSAGDHHGRRGSMLPWVFVLSVGLVAVVATLALRFLPGREVSEPPQPAAARNSPAPAPSKAAPSRSPETPAFLAKSVDMPFSRIRSGDFLMGWGESTDPRVGPAHLVSLTSDYYIARYEVTREQWNRVMPPGEQQEGDGKAPVNLVSWFDAIRFCNALSVLENRPRYYTIRDDVVTVEDREGPGYRLPTEAEWEFACRAGSKTRWSFGESAEELGFHAFFAANSGDVTHPVGLKLPNAFGLYDMYGNVAEWCWDWHDDYESPAKDPTGPSRPKGPKATWSRVLRGGDYGNVESDISSYHRSFAKPQSRNFGYGFRVSRNPDRDERRPAHAP